MPTSPLQCVCSVANCGGEFYCRGFCTKHYQRWRTHGDPLVYKFNLGAVCKIPDCVELCHAKGLCFKHYMRLRRHGTTDDKHGKAFLFLKNEALLWCSSECLIWKFAKANYGYGEVWIGGRKRLAHRVLCELAHGAAPEGKNDVAHSCGNRLCVNPLHLRWASRAENEADKLIHGTQARGERHGNASLTVDKVREIRALKGQMLQREVAEMFGVSPGLVSAIHRRKTWSWLE